MGWRANKRSGIITLLSSKARLYRSRVEQFVIDSSAHASSRTAYAFDCSVTCVSSPLKPEYGKIALELQGGSPKAFGLIHAVSALKHIIDLQIGGYDHQEAIFERDFVAESQIVDLKIGLDAFRRFTFAQERRERHLFGNVEQKRTGGKGRIKITEQPAPPPEQGKLSLEERLRWILTPPIQELLTDPQLALPAHPFPYQAFGIKWLMGRENALLADEMGLGKTMQAIIAARLLWREHKINQLLIICPKPLISTWQEEIDKWWPAATQNSRLAGSDRQFFLKLGTDNVTIKIINYEALARETDWLKTQKFTHDLIIIDEAQRIKNPESKAAQAVKALHAPRRWALTGTPLENKIEDVLSIFEFIRPGLLEWANPNYVRDRMKPFFLRRRADEVLPELPAKEDQDVPVTFESSQREAYDVAERDGVVRLNEKGETVTVQHVFALIKRLMQICNFEPVSGESAKLDRMKGDLEEIIESGRKLLIFSQFVAEPFGLKQLRSVLPRICKVVEMHGEVSDHQREAAKKSFNEDPVTNTMLLHYRVGGLGLNLQAANYVYLYDRWWNPAVEDQAVKTQVTIEGNPGKVADLKAGQKVVVTPAEGTATKISVPKAKAAKPDKKPAN